MVQKFIGIARLGKDPEIKNISSDTKVANLSLAFSEKYKDRSGERVEKTTWLNGVVFGNLVGVVEKYIHKGDLVYLEAKIQVDTYEKEGEKRSATKLIINSITMLGGNSNQESAPQSKPSSNAFAGEPKKDDFFDNQDDLPF